MHECLPSSLTAENLASWIVDNSADSAPNNSNKVLTDEEIQELEHKSSKCSREIDGLEEIKKNFMASLTDGNFDPDGDYDQVDSHFIIPATIGIKQLKAQREMADKVIRNGFRVDNIVLYSIPWPEHKKMVVMDIEGNEWEERTRDMRPDEINKYGGLFAVGDEQPDGPKEDTEESGDLIQEMVLVEDDKGNQYEMPKDEYDKQLSEAVQEPAEEEKPKKKKPKSFI